MVDRPDMDGMRFVTRKHGENGASRGIVQRRNRVFDRKWASTLRGIGIFLSSREILSG